jgi:hypothetical protein
VASVEELELVAGDVVADHAAEVRAVQVGVPVGAAPRA